MVANGQSNVAITPDLLLPDLLRTHPEARAVFDRYGLHGCGGPLGPYESIRFFARAHGVDEVRLLHELERAIAAPQSHGAAAAPGAPEGADTIYRRYFLGGILLALTAGATWGAWLLWTIAVNGSFRSISLHSINAHGEAQIFGWVGLFIMGFAYQAFPRLWHTALAAPRLAAWAFVLMIAGLIVRTTGIATAEAWSLALPTAMLGGALQVAAVLIFTGQILTTFVHSGARVEPYIGFVAASLAWFLVSSVVSIWHTWNTMTARSLEALIWYVATYQSPLRDLQIHGLALFMILGVSIRMLPALYEVPRVADRRAWRALALLVAAVLGEVALSLLSRWTGNPGLAACLPLPWAMLAAGSAMIVLPWRPWRPFPVHDRGAKFVRGGVCLAGPLAGHAPALTGVSIRVSPFRRRGWRALQPRLPRRDPPRDHRRLHLADDHGVRRQGRAHAQRRRSPDALGAVGAVPAGQRRLPPAGRPADADRLVSRTLPVTRPKRDAGGRAPGMVGPRPGAHHPARGARGRRPGPTPGAAPGAGRESPPRGRGPRLVSGDRVRVPGPGLHGHPAAAAAADRRAADHDCPGGGPAGGGPRRAARGTQCRDRRAPARTEYAPVGPPRHPDRSQAMTALASEHAGRKDST